ncbi:MAG TPA: SGNH/GDSL hydrolase family protein [Capsulimonadaceae bacterium]|jgi:hypothetical protein
MTFKPETIHREDIEWCDIWITRGGGTDLPRVLLIGDSITRAYYPEVEKLIGGDAAVSRLATSKSLGDPSLVDELGLAVAAYDWTVIHFNNGLHGGAYTEAEYAAHFADVIAFLKAAAPSARIIVATTTPTRERGNLSQNGEFTPRVVARNEIAAKVAADESLAVDDLFASVNERIELYSDDGVHFNPEGSATLAASVTESVRKALAVV